MSARSIRRAAERQALKAAREKNAPLQAAATESLQAEPQPVSQAQLDAKRANSLKSTGPRTAEGLAAVRLNAVKTALTGQTVLLPSDDAVLYQSHIRNYETQFKPVGPEECALVQSMLAEQAPTGRPETIADIRWRLNRIPALEISLMSRGRLEFGQDLPESPSPAETALLDLEVMEKYEKQFRNLHLQEARLARRREKETPNCAASSRNAKPTKPPLSNAPLPPISSLASAINPPIHRKLASNFQNRPSMLILPPSLRPASRNYSKKHPPKPRRPCKPPHSFNLAAERRQLKTVFRGVPMGLRPTNGYENPQVTTRSTNRAATARERFFPFYSDLSSSYRCLSICTLPFTVCASIFGPPAPSVNTALCGSSMLTFAKNSVRIFPFTVDASTFAEIVSGKCS